MNNDLKALTSSESNEWYTPITPYIDMVKTVFGGYIDLDPASSIAANRRIQAQRFWSVEDDALKWDWIADNVFLNPPYGKVKNDSQAGIFAQYMIQQYWQEAFRESILLVNSCTGAKWFQQLFDWTICFVDHRIHYEVPTLPEGINEDGVLECILDRTSEARRKVLLPKLAHKTLDQLIEFYYSQNQPSKDNVFVYMGPNWKRFADVFKSIGRIRIRSALLPQYVDELRVQQDYTREECR